MRDEASISAIFSVFRKDLPSLHREIVSRLAQPQRLAEYVRRFQELPAQEADAILRAMEQALHLISGLDEAQRSVHAYAAFLGAAAAARIRALVNPDSSSVLQRAALTWLARHAPHESVELLQAQIQHHNIDIANTAHDLYQGILRQGKSG